MSSRARKAEWSRHTHNVTRWRDLDVAERWVASAGEPTEKHFRGFDGHAGLWSLPAILGRQDKSKDLSIEVEVA